MDTKQHEKWMRCAMIWQMGVMMSALGTMEFVPDELKETYLAALGELTASGTEAESHE